MQSPDGHVTSRISGYRIVGLTLLASARFMPTRPPQARKMGRLRAYSLLFYGVGKNNDSRTPAGTEEMLRFAG